MRVTTDPQFDLLVIGSGPAGQKGAIAAAKLGKRVAVVDTREMVGGVSLHSGTIPSKTLREAILYLTGFRQRAFYGPDYRVDQHITIAELWARVAGVVAREMSVVNHQFGRNGVELLPGAARFVDPHTLEVQGSDGTKLVRAEHVLICCGTRPAQSPEVPCDGKRILLADQLGQIEELPRELIVVGGGVIGLEYASMMAALGIEVTLVEQRETILDFVDLEIVEALSYHLRRLGMTMRLGEKVSGVSIDERGRVSAALESGKHVHGTDLLYTVGRQANSDLLRLEAAGLSADARGKLTVDENYRTAVPHIYAAGDVIGFPALASTSMEQGRLAALHMFGGTPCKSLAVIPYGIYTIPEISMVGRTERDLTKSKVPYEFGIAKYEELAKGQMVGDETGLLKLLFDPVSLKLLGVHAIGESATEIIHIGQAVLSLGGTIEYFRDTVFNYPTFAEAYKVAAFDGLNKL
ncbi:MAG: Si-specific NAD(P)(+) transhydrogenase [Planctomycetes bacterium]|nr:Si-specific NAD(P)(+) transhydrogenase [Planctomycetota bacterium]